MTLLRPLRAAAAVLLLTVLAGCGSSSSQESAGTHGSAVSTKRCAENEKAGALTYLTSYSYQASASILEVLAAKELGYFDDLCLDVAIKPGSGDTPQNAKLLAAGKVQFTGLAEQDVIDANATDTPVLGLASYADAGLDVLMTGKDISDLTQLDGATLGEKGSVPVSVQAMMIKEAVDWSSLKLVKVGYDPSVLARGQVDALTGFASNEPLQLEADDYPVKVWQPADFGVPGSIVTLATSPDFASAHPSVVQDFLRAAFRAYRYCAQKAHVAQCVGFVGDYEGEQSFDRTHETKVWQTEVKVGVDNPVPGRWGSVDLGNVRALAGIMRTYADSSASDADAVAGFDNSYAASVVRKDGSVIWPAG
ncbi:MAG: ABC transporter substrate-binding protein [Nocardioides sp.]|uniref:ABC transporter substrate-binding protein n=1 Tax=Nocardioides sp. TaxID=35761 RepID=UPI0039E6AED5